VTRLDRSAVRRKAGAHGKAARTEKPAGMTLVMARRPRCVGVCAWPGLLALPGALTLLGAP
jgi:hypothetical protein